MKPNLQLRLAQPRPDPKQTEPVVGRGFASHQRFVIRKWLRCTQWFSMR